MALSKTTQDHDEIRAWAEARGGKPAEAASTHENGMGILRIEFPAATGANDANLQEISWEQFFEKFDASALSLVYRDVTAEGVQSNFNRLIHPENADMPTAGAKTASAKKTTGRQAPSAKKHHGKKTPSVKAAEHKAQAKKGAAKKTTLSRTAARRIPAKKTAGRLASESETVAKKASPRKTSEQKTAARRTPAQTKAPTNTKAPAIAKASAKTAGRPAAPGTKGVGKTGAQKTPKGGVQRTAGSNRKNGSAAKKIGRR